MEPTYYEKVMSASKVVDFPAVIEALREQLPPGEPSYAQFMSTPSMMTTGNLMHVIGSNAAVIAQIAFHVYCFHVGDGRTYEVSENIAEMLLNTDLNVDTSMVKSPFNEIQVVVPPLLHIKNPQTGIHDVCQLCIHLNEAERVLRVLCVGAPNAASIHVLDDTVFFFRVPLNKAKVSDCLGACLKEWEDDPHREILGTENAHLIPRLYKFALNILLYITSSDADIRKVPSKYGELAKKLGRTGSKSKKARIRERMASESRQHHYVVGRGIQLSPEEGQLYGALRASKGMHSFRYPVGGHWRKQWYGSENTKFQKLKWIRPHFRGPELAEILKNVGTLR